MAILRSASGKFYEIPDDELNQYEVASDLVAQVAGMAGEGGAPEGEGPEGGEAEGGGGGAGVEPYGYYRRRRHYWRNHWRNCWRNCY